METATVQKLRKSLRIMTDEFDEEISTLTDACKTDMKLAGVRYFEESDPLCQQALEFYCKANFGYTDDSDKFLERYRMLRDTMAVSSCYGTPELE